MTSPDSTTRFDAPFEGDLTADLEFALKLADAADRTAMQRFDAPDLDVSLKADASHVTEADLASTVRVIASELRKYGQALDRKPRWLVFNKIDAVQDADQRIGKALRALRWKRPWFKVSALTGQGCTALMKNAARELKR